MFVLSFVRLVSCFFLFFDFLGFIVSSFSPGVNVILPPDG
nr:MAG TPA: hypothetical protein [Caudoviricetes sp.]